MYINNKFEAKIASDIASKYLPDAGFEPSDFLRDYTTNTIQKVAPHAPTLKRTNAERAIVQTIRAYRNRR